jgi:23S rRNA (adenine2030-N6)-methyltransferase
MLSYQHGYHAGSFADVVKHLTLTRLLSYMLSKEKPLFYFESHAGRGLYDLHSQQSAKTKEHEEGINLLWKNRDTLPSVFEPYIKRLGQYNKPYELRYYPGSPAIAINQLREQDRIFCSELHPREFEYLEQLPRFGKRVFYSHSDGLHDLKALIPPAERRGLIFMDPSFELKSEYKDIPKALLSAHQRFSTGVFCLWYPLVDKHLNEQLYRGMAKIPSAKMMRIEFYQTDESRPGMTGCGLWIINPPYTLYEEMNTALKYLSSLFNPGHSSYLVETVSGLKQQKGVSHASQTRFSLLR